MSIVIGVDGLMDSLIFLIVKMNWIIEISKVDFIVVVEFGVVNGDLDKEVCK